MEDQLIISHTVKSACRMSTKKLPYTDPEWRIPGSIFLFSNTDLMGFDRYTGYVEGLKETYKKTPILCQKECHEPEEGSFMFTRTKTQSNLETGRDPCNETTKKPQPDVLWPNLQDHAAQEMFRPPQSSVSLGNGLVRKAVLSSCYGLQEIAVLTRSRRLTDSILTRLLKRVNVCVVQCGTTILRNRVSLFGITTLVPTTV